MVAVNSGCGSPLIPPRGCGRRCSAAFGPAATGVVEDVTGSFSLIWALLALVMVFALCACGSKTEDGNKDAASIKVGFICLHDENSTYDKNFIDAAKAACKNAGLSEDQYIIKTNIPEGQECYNAAAELVDAGCNVVFADSFGHEDFMIQAAKDMYDTLLGMV